MRAVMYALLLAGCGGVETESESESACGGREQACANTCPESCTETATRQVCEEYESGGALIRVCEWVEFERVNRTCLRECEGICAAVHSCEKSY